MRFLIHKIGEMVQAFIGDVLWKLNNRHNYTRCNNLAFFPNISVGRWTYGKINATFENTEYRLTIGSYCSIAPDVKFIVSGEHKIDSVSTYPFKVKIFRAEKYEALSKGDIVVEDDVWIGANSIILSGIKIGRGAVIGAGSVVTRDIPPYAIVCGNPAIIKRFRFSEQIIDKLVQLDFSNIKFEEADVDLLYEKLTEENVDIILEKLQKTEKVDIQ